MNNENNIKDMIEDEEEVISLDDIKMFLLHCRACGKNKFFVNFDKKNEILVIICSVSTCLEPYPIVNYKEEDFIKSIILPK